jgi:hypothetical protein
MNEAVVHQRKELNSQARLKFGILRLETKVTGECAAWRLMGQQVRSGNAIIPHKKKLAQAAVRGLGSR